MTSRGYDSKAVKVSKSVKRVAATILDNQQRREFIRGYAQAEAINARMATRRNRGE
jgi:hypothetical protein